MKQILLMRIKVVGILSCLALPAWPQNDLTKLSLVDLMNIEVTSVAKKEQKLSQTASAVFVITQDDIRRSGASNIPDLLRMVPGVDVAQINSNKWAISVRGFNGQYSNKLLVLIDGRSVYNPLLSGVFWDAQDVSLESIDRIEVIRGPGATVWGANAVNGVINVITKKATETQGVLLTTGGGTYDRGSGTARYGGKLSDKVAYRVYVDGFARNHLPSLTSEHGDDDSWSMVHGGFRLDGRLSVEDSITVEADVQNGNAGELTTSVTSIVPPLNVTLPRSDHFSGWNLLSRWNHATSPDSVKSLQVYFDRTMRGDGTYGAGLNTLDLDFQHHGVWGARQDIVWGLGYRFNSDSTLSTPRISFLPQSRNTQLFSGFLQDDICLLPGRVYMDLGGKLEHNDYTGVGFQPSARIRWTPHDRDMFWAAASQAERTPARNDTSISYNLGAMEGPGGLPLVVSLFGNPRYKNEILLANEVGYRSQITQRISFDGTMFFNNYHDLTSVEPGTIFLHSSPSPLYLVFPYSVSNLNRGESHGLELVANWAAATHWTLRSSYSFLTTHIHRDPLSQDLTTGLEVEGGSPQHQAQMRSQVDLPGHWGWNTSAYYVGGLPALQVPSNTRVDSNLSRQLTEGLSIALAGENLLKDRHLEYTGNNSTVSSTMGKRSASIKLTWQF